MAIDKDLALRLVDAFEDLYLDNRILNAVARDKLGSTVTEKLIAKVKADPKFLSPIRAKFAPVRERIEQSSDPWSVMQQFLEVFPSKKDVK